MDGAVVPSLAAAPVPVWRRALLRRILGLRGNLVLTLLAVLLLAAILPPLWHWAIGAATWAGESRRACAPDGACWAFVRARFGLFLYGRYPMAERWRVDLALVLLVAGLFACTALRRHRGAALLGLLVAVPLVGGVLLAGGVPGLPAVPTADWGGLMLNVVLAFVAVGGAVPLGIALAFGRRSRLPVLRWGSTALVEFWRGVPLLAVLFMGLVLLPLFLPGGVQVDTLVRALVVLVLFTSAYVAEAVRGGLQGVAPGQAEAARALGLHEGAVHLLIELPQAMRIALPGIVGIAVDLFKDTTLVSIVGLFDLMGIVTQSLKDPAWQGLAAEGYVFAAVMFFVCCAVLSGLGAVLEWQMAQAGKR